jgi:hypothetical protein
MTENVAFLEVSEADLSPENSSRLKRRPRLR